MPGTMSWLGSSFQKQLLQGRRSTKPWWTASLFCHRHLQIFRKKTAEFTNVLNLKVKKSAGFLIVLGMVCGKQEVQLELELERQRGSWN